MATLECKRTDWKKCSEVKDEDPCEVCANAGPADRIFTGDPWQGAWDEANAFIEEAFNQPATASEPRHDPLGMLGSTLAAWCSTQVMEGKAANWKFALAAFLHDANMGLEWCPKVSDFVAKPDKMSEYLRGDHL